MANRRVISRAAALSAARVQRDPGEAPHAPTGSLPRQVAQTKDALTNVQTNVRAAQSWTDGTVIRTRIGLQSDGKYGLRVWNSAGVLVHDFTTT